MTDHLTDPLALAEHRLLAPGGLDLASLDRAFERLGESLLAAQEEYLETKRLDEALFGDEYE